MPKKEKEEKNENGAGGKILTVLMILLIVLIWLAILALLIKFDVGGLGSTTLRPILKDVPVINRILPDVSEEEKAYENAYPYKSLEEAIQRIKDLELLTDNLTEENNDYAARQLEMQKELDALRHYEEEHDAFMKRVAEFDREVVYNEKAPSTDEYMKWYEGMYPENAAAIYEELLAAKQVDESIQREAKYLSRMKPAEVAAVLSEYSSDIDMVCRLLFCMKDSFVSDVLAAMDSLYAARILNRMVELDMELLK